MLYAFALLFPFSLTPFLCPFPKPLPKTPYLEFKPNAPNDIYHYQKKSKRLLFKHRLITSLLPDLHLTDHHLRLLPRRKPRIFGINEISRRRCRLINPRLPRLAVLKPAVRPTDRDIENEVKLLIKRRIDAASLPGVLNGGAVRPCGDLELAAVPEVLDKRTVEHLQQAGVDVGEEVFLAPLETKHVGGFGESGVQGVTLDVSAVPGVGGFGGTPVHGRGDDVVTALSVGVVVAAGLHDVDFARGRPGTVGVVHGHHPDCRPKPVALRESGCYFDAAVLFGLT